MIRNKIVKGLFSAFFSIIISANILSASALESNESVNEAVEVVTGLGIMTETQSGSFDGETFVNRAQTAEILAVMYDVSNASFSGQSYFDDVSEKSKYFSSINTARDYGYMRGYTDGTFRPEQTITYSEALQCMLRVGGYSDYAAAVYGDSNEAVLRAASENGITKGVTADINSPITRNIMARIIYNTLFVDIMEVSQVLPGGDATYTAKDGETVLKSRMGIEVIKGRLNAVGPMSLLDGVVLDNSKLAVDDNIYINSSDYHYYDKLGYYGEFYVKTEDVTEAEVRFVAFDKHRNESITIVSDNIIKAELDSITYLEEATGKNKLLKLSDDLTVVYNGRVLSSYDESVFVPDYGKITVVDDNLLIIYDVKTIVVDRFDYTNEMLYDLYSNTGKKFTDDSKNIYLSDSGKEMGNPLYNAPYRSVIDIMESRDGELMVAVLTDKSFTGKIIGFDYSEGTVNVDGTEYRLSKNFMGVYTDEEEEVKLYEELKIGMSVEFYLNSYGEVAGCNIDYTSGFSYGYLLSAKEFEDDENKIIFKIYTANGETVKYNNGSKVIVNDSSSLSDRNKILSSINSTASQLIKYKLNSENQITEIQTASDNRNGNERFVKDKFTLDFKTDLSGKATRIYTYSVGANFSIGDNTKVFFIPDDLQNAKKFKAGDKTLLSGDVRDANIELYDTDEAGMAKVIIYFSGGSGGTPNSNLWKSDAVVIDKVKSVVIDDEGTTGCEITGFRAGKEISLKCEDEELENYSTGNYWMSGYGGLYKNRTVKELRRGDIILAETDTTGNVTGFLLMLSADELPASYKEIMSDGGTPTPDNHLAGTSTHYGKVIKRYKPSLLVNANGDGTEPEWNKTFATGAANVYLFDKGRNEISIVTADEVKEDDVVFIRKNLTAVKEVYVLR